MTGAVIATALPFLDPDSGRVDLDLPPGLTVAAIVAMALPPGVPAEAARVAIVTAGSAQMVPRDCWGQVRPKAGCRVVIRVTPGEGGLRAILSIVVAVAAVALGQFWALGLGFAAGTPGFALASGLIGLGVSVAGQLLINALIPPPAPEDDRRRSRYAVSGWRNRVEPDGAVPIVLGQIRYAPPFACRPYTEIRGDWQYIRALFTFGYGPVGLSDLKIGETSLDDYDEVEVEIREGLAEDAPVSITPRQVVEESVGAELIRPLPRNDRGEVIDGTAEVKPVVRTTGADASGVSVILAWPAGLVFVNDKGNPKSHWVEIRIEQRLVQDEAWTEVRVLKVRARKLEAFYRQIGWDFPERGRWQVRLTMLTKETEDQQYQQRTSWVAIQTIRPEYPLAFGQPLALVALRIKATHQLNGSLDNVSALAARLCPDWDHVAEAWVLRETSNPAALFRAVLQSPANPKPVADGEIDLELLQDWHDFCRVKGLKYDRVIDGTSSTLREVLSEVAAAGRASPRHDGLRWGVTIDRPDDLVVDHINPRNSSQFRLTRRYFTPPHAIRVKFLDATNDYAAAERLVRWPGYEGSIELTETMEFPGLTDPADVWRETRRRMYETLLRPDAVQVLQDGAVRTATRGDRVTLSHDVLTSVQRAARVLATSGAGLLIDETVTMAEGGAYAIRFRQIDAEDTIGSSLIRSVRTDPGETDFLTLDGSGAMPEAGDVIHFGPVERLDRAMIVRGVEAAEGQASLLHLVDAAPEIDEILDAETPPEWSGRAGAEIGDSLSAPAVPTFTWVVSGAAFTGSPDHIDYLLAPGTGGVPTATFDVRHRLGAGSWTTVSIAVADGGGTIEDYEAGDAVELQARAVSAVGVASDWTDGVALVVGETDAPAPGALDSASIAITVLPGGALVDLVTPADPAIGRLQVYRSATAVLDRDTDAWGDAVAAGPARRIVLPVGDTGIVNLFANSGFASTADWILDADWSIAGGVATKVAGGSTRAMRQNAAGATFVGGATLRCGMKIATWTAGSFLFRSWGTTTVSSGTKSAAGDFLTTIVLPASPTQVGLAGFGAAAGTIDDVVAYVETAACLPQGTQYLWIEPQNADGVPGPVAGPFTIKVI